MAVVEHWNGHAGIRQDLFGCWDVLAVGNGQTLAVQATSGSNVSARVHKLLDENAATVEECLAAGWRCEVWGWRKVKRTGRYVRRVVRIVWPEGTAAPLAEEASDAA